MESSPKWTCHPIVFEDPHLIAIHKPASVLAHPNREGSGAVRCAFQGPYDMESRKFETPKGPLWLMHRLDQETSGVLLAAKSSDIASALREAFETGLVQKKYIAIVKGRVIPPQGSWRDCMFKQAGKALVRSRMGRGTPNAELRYRLYPLPPPPPWASKVRREISLLEIQLITGRTHQIRVQAASRHLPVAGDRVYGDFAWNRRLRQEIGLNRLFLHAARLTFQHPKLAGRVQLTSEIPSDLQVSLEKLGIDSDQVFKKISST